MTFIYSYLKNPSVPRGTTTDTLIFYLHGPNHNSKYFILDICICKTGRAFENHSRGLVQLKDKLCEVGEEMKRVGKGEITLIELQTIVFFFSLFKNMIHIYSLCYLNDFGILFHAKVVLYLTIVKWKMYLKRGEMGALIHIDCP